MTWTPVLHWCGAVPWGHANSSTHCATFAPLRRSWFHVEAWRPHAWRPHDRGVSHRAWPAQGLARSSPRVKGSSANGVAHSGVGSLETIRLEASAFRVWPTQELARSTARVNGSSANDRPRKGGLAARAPGEIPTDGFLLVKYRVDRSNPRCSAGFTVSGRFHLTPALDR